MAALGRLANKTDKTISASGKGRLWFFRPAAVIAREYALSAKSRQHAASTHMRIFYCEMAQKCSADFSSSAILRPQSSRRPPRGQPASLSTGSAASLSIESASTPLCAPAGFSAPCPFDRKPETTYKAPPVVLVGPFCTTKPAFGWGQRGDRHAQNRQIFFCKQGRVGKSHRKEKKANGCLWRCLGGAGP